MTVKNFVKQLVPSPILNIYHLSLAYLASLVFGWPSKKLIVIGVTGTNGKSTTVNLIAKILSETSPVIWSSTVN
jgi:UDP-N-acetylmuramoyl-L-alanyl-D-glutamate--2,6-diaminopimelate ligase